MRIFSQKECNFSFKHFTTCYFQDHLGKKFLRGIKINIIDIQKNQRRHCANTLIAIYKRVIFDKMVQICSRHFVNRRMQKSTTECTFRHPDGRFQQLDVTQSTCSTEIFYLIFMNFHNIRKGQKLYFTHLASSSKDFA